MLTKSKYLLGVQCPRLLWVKEHEPDRIPEPCIDVKWRMEQGTEVGVLAQKLFPSGVLMPTDFKENLIESCNSIGNGKVLFEAGFVYGDCYSRADILVPVGDAYDIIEVKSSSSVKDVNLHDLAFQKYVYVNNGIKINKCYIMHLNKEYVRSGSIELDKLFVKEEVSVDDILVQEKVSYLFKVLGGKCPDSIVGSHCSDPYSCDLKSECWNHEVLDLYYGNTKAYSLISDGCSCFKDIPDDFVLNDKQYIQKRCCLEKSVHVDVDGIKTFVDGLVYPLFYMDFESFNVAVPLYDGFKPYSQVCFQYSVHVESKEKLDHFSYICPCGDPRSKFLSKLLDVLGSKGSIIVYNKSFEIGRLKEMGSYLGVDVSSVVSRIVDLIDVFRNFYYYDYRQKGSCSIKKVLPCFGFDGYSSLDINNGSLASFSYYDAVYCLDEDGKLSKESGLSKGQVSKKENKEGDKLVSKKEKVFKDLEKYCSLDTYAMKVILDKLQGCVKEKE